MTINETREQRRIRLAKQHPAMSSVGLDRLTDSYDRDEHDHPSPGPMPGGTLERLLEPDESRTILTDRTPRSRLPHTNRLVPTSVYPARRAALALSRVARYVELRTGMKGLDPDEVTGIGWNDELASLYLSDLRILLEQAAR